MNKYEDIVNLQGTEAVSPSAQLVFICSELTEKHANDDFYTQFSPVEYDKNLA